MENCSVSVWIEDSLKMVKALMSSQRKASNHPGYPILSQNGGNAGAESVVKNMLKIRNITVVIFKVWMGFLTEVGELM